MLNVVHSCCCFLVVNEAVGWGVWGICPTWNLFANMHTTITVYKYVPHQSLSDSRFSTPLDEFSNETLMFLVSVSLVGINFTSMAFLTTLLSSKLS